MKIAYVYDAVYPWIKGGAEKRIYEISKRLVEKGHEVHWFFCKGIKDYIGWKNEEPCGKPQGINIHISTTPAATLWQATGNPQVKIRKG